jgi:hypothetical protein
MSSFLEVTEEQESLNPNTYIQTKDILDQVEPTGNTSRNNVPNKTLLVGTFVCAVLGTFVFLIPF